MMIRVSPSSSTMYRPCLPKLLSLSDFPLKVDNLPAVGIPSHTSPLCVNVSERYTYGLYRLDVWGWGRDVPRAEPR